MLKLIHYGFLETPYQVVKNGQVTKEVVYVSAIDEIDHTIAQANSKVDSKGFFKMILFQEDIKMNLY